MWVLIPVMPGFGVSHALQDLLSLSWKNSYIKIPGPNGGQGGRLKGAWESLVAGEGSLKCVGKGMS
jgi:hypothetical protein